MNDLMTKSFMSYVDLKKAAMKDLEAGTAYDFEMNASHQTDPNLAQFLEDAEKIKEEMKSIREVLVRLQEANEESKALHKPEALKTLRNKMNADITGVLKKARIIRTQIEKMNEETRNSKNTAPTDRARGAVTNGLQKKLKDLMMDFQGLRQKMMKDHREMIGRSYYTVKGEKPDEEVIEKIVSNGGGGEEFLQRAIQEGGQKGKGKGEVVDTVVEIQDRNAAVKEIEKSLLELHQIFLDMAVMVEAQGEQLDDIHHNVVNASHYVKEGSKQLSSAKGYQRGSRKCMCLGMILLLVLILVIVIPIATSFSKS